MNSSHRIRAARAARAADPFNGVEVNQPLPRVAGDARHTFRAGQIMPAVRLLQEHGLDWESSMRRVGLTPEVPGPADPISALKALRFLHDVAYRQGIPDLGTRMMGFGSTEFIDPAVLALLARPRTLIGTLRTARDLCVRQSPSVDIWLVPRPDELWVCHRSAVPVEAGGFEHFEAYRTLFLIELVRRFAGPEWTPRALAVASRRSFGNAFAEASGDCPVSTGHGVGIVPVPLHLLTLHRGTPAENTAATDSPLWLDLLEGMILSRLSTDVPGIDVAAEAMGLSRRTFQRRLESRGCTFRNLVGRLRMEEAHRLLVHTDLPIHDIGHHLGYSEPGNFVRAFKRASGTTPGLFRTLGRQPPE